MQGKGGKIRHYDEKGQRRFGKKENFVAFEYGFPLIFLPPICYHCFGTIKFAQFACTSQV